MRGPPWVMVATDLLAHPKSLALQRRTGDARSVLSVVALWMHVGRFFCEGMVLDTPENRLALQAAALWSSEWGDMITLLVEVGFLDLRRKRIVVHDWGEWSGKYHARLAKDRAAYRAKAASSGKKPRTDSDGSVSQKEKKKEIEKEIENSDSSEASSEPVAVSPVVVVLPCVGTGEKEHPITEADLETWKKAYPAIDGRAEAHKMALWLDANPANRKTARGAPKFIANWLARAQNGSRAASTPQPTRVTLPPSDFRDANSDQFLAGPRRPE